MRRPVNQPYTITTEHGEYIGANAKFLYHSGVDYAVPTGRPVYAPASGKVVFSGWSNTGGNMLTIFDGQFYHRLMHNSRLHVGVGAQVSEGQHLADAGSTGLSSGPHVHWDICRKQVATAFSDYVPNADWLAGKFNVPKGDEPMTPDQERLAYRIVLGREMEGLPSGRTAMQFITGAQAELNASREHQARLLADLRAALANEQSRPPREVIKEVEKIVEKPVEVIKVVEVEPSWLVKTREFILSVLKINKGGSA